MKIETLELIFRLSIMLAIVITAVGFIVVGNKTDDLQAQVDSLKSHTENLENTCCYAVEEWSE